MADLDLGALSAQLKLDGADLLKGAAEAAKAFEGIDKAAQKTAATVDSSVEEVLVGFRSMSAGISETNAKAEDIGKTLKNALKGEVIVNGVNRIASALNQMGGEFKGLGETATAAGAVMQGLFQGGILGAGIAAAGVGISHLVTLWGEAEKAAADAEAAQVAAMSAHVARMTDLGAQLDDASAKLKASLGSLRGGGSVDSILSGMSADALGKREFDLSQQASGVGAQWLAEQKKLARMEAAPTYAGGFQEAQTTSQRSVVDALRKQLDGLNAALDEVSGAANVLAAKTVAETKAKEAARKEAEAQARAAAFANDLKSARNFKPEGLFSPGELARMAKAADAFGSDGDTRREREARQQRNRGYAENGAEIVTPDGDKARSAALNEKPTAFSSNADMVTDSIMSEMEGLALSLDDFGVAIDDIVQAAGSVAPKAANLAGAILSSTSPQEAIAKVVLQLAALTPEFQFLGKQMDGFVQTLSKVVGSIIRPFVPVITEIFNLAGLLVNFALALDKINPMGDILKIVLSGLFEVLNLLSASVAALTVGIDWVAGNIKNAIIDAAESVLKFANVGGIFDDTLRDLEKMRATVVADVGKAMGEAFDREAARTAEGIFGGLDDLGGAADKVAQSLLNLPAGFKVNAAIYDAANASGDVWGGYVPPGSTASMPTAAAAAATASTGSVYNFYAPIYVNGDGSFEANVARGAPQLPPPNRPTTYPPNP